MDYPRLRSQRRPWGHNSGQQEPSTRVARQQESLDSGSEAASTGPERRRPAGAAAVEHPAALQDGQAEQHEEEVGHGAHPHALRSLGAQYEKKLGMHDTNDQLEGQAKQGKEDVCWSNRGCTALRVPHMTNKSKKRKSDKRT